MTQTELSYFASISAYISLKVSVPRPVGNTQKGFAIIKGRPTSQPPWRVAVLVVKKVVA